MVITSKSEWERSQQRASLQAVALQIPCHADSKVLLLSARIPQLCLELASAATSKAFSESVQRLIALDETSDANIALMTCLLLRAAGNSCHPQNQPPSDKLGMWNTWKLSPGV